MTKIDEITAKIRQAVKEAKTEGWTIVSGDYILRIDDNCFCCPQGALVCKRKDIVDQIASPSTYNIGTKTALIAIAKELGVTMSWIKNFAHGFDGFANGFDGKDAHPELDVEAYELGTRFRVELDPCSRWP